MKMNIKAIFFSYKISYNCRIYIIVYHNDLETAETTKMTYIALYKLIKVIKLKIYIWQFEERLIYDQLSYSCIPAGLCMTISSDVLNIWSFSKFENNFHILNRFNVIFSSGTCHPKNISYLIIFYILKAFSCT